MAGIKRATSIDALVRRLEDGGRGNPSWRFSSLDELRALEVSQRP